MLKLNTSVWPLVYDSSAIYSSKAKHEKKFNFSLQNIYLLSYLLATLSGLQKTWNEIEITTHMKKNFVSYLGSVQL